MLTAVMLTLVLASGSPVQASGGACSPDLAAVGLCSEVTNTGSQVDITAGLDRPGSTPPENDPGVSHPSESDPDPAPPEAGCDVVDPRCGFVVVGPPDVTLADIASFRPAAPSLTGEPTGFGVVGMPTNLVAAASEQRLSGELLGWDVTVRFVPAAFVFDHGDGTTATSTTGGASWERLGQAQFSPTATSHVYRDRGTYPVAVTVQYAASVDFGSGTWRPVPGRVSVTTAGYDVRVVEVRTALVDRTCAEDPSGPGC
jgi:hypothetical protein